MFIAKTAASATKPPDIVCVLCMCLPLFVHCMVVGSARFWVSSSERKAAEIPQTPVSNFECAVNNNKLASFAYRGRYIRCGGVESKRWRAVGSRRTHTFVWHFLFPHDAWSLTRMCFTSGYCKHDGLTAMWWDLLFAFYRSYKSVINFKVFPQIIVKVMGKCRLTTIRRNRSIINLQPER